MYKSYLLILLGFFLFSCQNKEEITAFYQNETTDIILETKELIDGLGFSNYTLRAHYHRSIGKAPISRNVKSVRAIGDGLLPVLESVSDSYPYIMDDYVKTFSNDFNGYYDQKTTVTNYPSKNEKNEVLYDYISVLVIFEDIAKEQRDELVKVLNMYIGNANRGDTVYVVSKTDFNE